MGYRGPEISGDEEGYPIWKPSNTNKTGGGAERNYGREYLIEHNALFFELETPDFA